MLTDPQNLGMELGQRWKPLINSVGLDFSGLDFLSDRKSRRLGFFLSFIFIKS